MKLRGKKSSFWSKLDWWLIVPMVILLILSLLVISSLPVQGAGSLRVWIVQLLAIAVGLIIALLVSRTTPDWWRKSSPWWYGLSVLLLIITLLWGTEILGARRWIGVGSSFELQVSEVAKLGLVLLLARFLSRSGRQDSWKILGSIIYASVVVGLILFQPDLDNALLLSSLMVIMLIISGLDWRWLLGLLAGIALIGFFSVNHLQVYQKQRLLSFKNQNTDNLGTNYNANQAKIAIGSGGLMGEGISGGSQSELRFLPSQSTDFIFAVVAEKLGFLGAVAVILALTVMLVRLWWLSLTSSQAFQRLMLSGIAWVLSLEVLINIGMNVGLLPVSGIQLPFVSYGGTHIIMEIIMLSLVMVVAQRESKSASNSLQTDLPLLT